MHFTGDYGSRYMFPSLVQAVAHQVAHHHFGFSSSTLREDSVVIHLLVKSEWMASNGRSAINGYAYSAMVDSLPIENVIICGCTYMLKTLSEFLA
eukprot:1450254-Amphidinium_carterae.1